MLRRLPAMALEETDSTSQGTGGEEPTKRQKSSLASLAVPRARHAMRYRQFEVGFVTAEDDGRAPPIERASKPHSMPMGTEKPRKQ
mmetsp:Transcript_10405/g.63522  ORF Transcript_10405/g.63522 Transcript_10405/m.63522 type:complete len:86 (+) Transcript_10405:408-665(+)